MSSGNKRTFGTFVLVVLSNVILMSCNFVSFVFCLVRICNSCFIRKPLIDLDASTAVMELPKFESMSSLRQ